MLSNCGGGGGRGGLERLSDTRAKRIVRNMTAAHALDCAAKLDIVFEDGISRFRHVVRSNNNRLFPGLAAAVTLAAHALRQ
jgi:hypothetical protein